MTVDARNDIAQRLRQIADEVESMTIACPKENDPVVEDLKRFVITSHSEGDTLAVGDTITWVDNGTLTNANDTADVYVDDVDQGPSTSAGSYVLTDVSAGAIEVCIKEILRNDANEVLGIGEECCYQFVGAATTDQDNLKLSADFGTTDVPFGSVTESMFEGFFSQSSGAFAGFGFAALDNVSIVDGCMRVKYDPVTTIGTTASTRTIFIGNLTPSQCYEVEQTVTLEGPTFDFGGPSGQQTIKLGFGLGGGSDTTGGNGNDPCGWTLRWITRGDEFMGYDYSFGRPAATYGRDIPTGVTAVAGQTYNLRMKVCINTAGNYDGSYELYIDNNLVASDYAMLWMDYTQCSSETANVIDSVIFTSFYGGSNSSSQSWWPDSTQYIEFCEPCYTALDS